MAIGDFDLDETALVEELDIAATPRIFSNIYEAVVAAAQSEAGFSGNVWLCDLEDWDIIIIASSDKGDFPAYSIVAKSYVSDDFSASTNSAFVQRIEGFKMGKKGVVSGLASFAFGKAREKNETAAQWGEAFDMVKGFKKEMRGGKYAKWAESVQSLVHTAFAIEAFNADVEQAADYLTGDLNA